MAEALITLKISPAEFDLIRETLVKQADQLKASADATGTRTESAQYRRENRAKAMQLTDILQRLR